MSTKFVAFIFLATICLGGVLSFKDISENAGKKSALTKLLNLKPARFESFKADNRMCGLCISSINKLHGALQQNSTEVAVDQFLLNLCVLLPSRAEADLCSDVIQNYFLEFYNYIRDSTDPGIVCKILKLCDK